MVAEKNKDDTFKIVAWSDPQEFQDGCNQWLAAGWVLHGESYVQRGKGDNPDLHCQVFIAPSANCPYHGFLLQCYKDKSIVTILRKGENVVRGVIETIDSHSLVILDGKQRICVELQSITGAGHQTE